MLNNKMYTLMQSFVKIHKKMTELCSFNEENPQFLSISRVMQNLLQSNSLGFSETLQIQLNYYIWDAMLEK